MKEKALPKFTYSSCLACGICVQACPVSALALEKTDVDHYNKAYPVLVGECISCKICEKECPFGAVVVV
jgi:formate hydrogenlyase subunit 6/NADH:ubiquinone oxidoreductase subunit I